ncbi:MULTISPECIES: hypothetical protein [unclassified Streptomyces]|uniref:Uncharacterized protein n=1 Tax=Streptomyces flavovirens TaxID=52258 RepID=A0ABV8NEA8_9ACTN|nr:MULTISPECIES: hypothetical protein [unclassified Streptomyces]MYR66326.1 hypothetical protein [Streptomyces sp. SID4939]MYS02800.1 hypothetical protein [Streptomyces sp. SID4940]MYT64434.1 hypothetical protein [Streptomyces sp. SID8357]MYT87247.1 hypothetical protein [Streptomyces sp. SID8360]MYU34696.1 hypothetical protein [Streptomyces sp. SID8358]MYW37190.1 hypothetical protein [Streptomyces sp. SID1]HBF82369.1 hypothetical protein [Streptomyces sp.]
MNQCTGLLFLPPPAYVTRLATPDRPMEAGHVLCELGEGHDDDHAGVLWDDDANDGAVWARWDGYRRCLVGLPWCTATDVEGDACGLFAGHPSGHSWEVVDPTQEAILAHLVQEHPHLHRDQDGPDSP